MDGFPAPGGIVEQVVPLQKPSSLTTSRPGLLRRRLTLSQLPSGSLIAEWHNQLENSNLSPKLSPNLTHGMVDERAIRWL